MQTGKFGPAVNYEPNSFGGPTECPVITEPSLHISGDADRYNHRQGNDDYGQAGDLFRLMNPEEQQRLCANIARSMAGVPREIIMRQICHFFRAEPAYGIGVARILGIQLDGFGA
jgi:catalase